MNSSAIAEWFGDRFEDWSTVVIVFLVILAVLVVNLVIRKVLDAFLRRSRPGDTTWRDAFLDALGPPLRAMVWIVGLTVAVRVLTYEEEASLLGQLFPPTRDLGVIAVITWFLIRSVHRVERGLYARAQAQGRELDVTASDAISKLVRASIVITAVLVAMQTLGFSISGILAFGGIGGIAIGFAAQGLVANLFGGLTIYASRPFNVGEWIIMPGTEVMGEVQEIGWRATKVMGFDRRPFYVPNAMFNTAVLINHSRMTARRIEEHVQVRVRDIDKVHAIVADGKKMLAEHPGIQHDFFVFNFDTCGDFSLKLLVYAFTVGTDYNEYMDTKEDILLRIADIVRRHGGELAVPTSTVHVPDGLEFRPRPSPGRPDAFAQGLIPDPQAG